MQISLLSIDAVLVSNQRIEMIEVVLPKITYFSVLLSFKFL